MMIRIRSAATTSFKFHSFAYNNIKASNVYKHTIPTTQLRVLPSSLLQCRRHINYWDAMHQRQVEASKFSFTSGFQSQKDLNHPEQSSRSRRQDELQSLGNKSATTASANPKFMDIFLDPNSAPAPNARFSALDAAKQNDVPSDVRMLTRDFIDMSLYHPVYGYFSKKAYIFSPPETIQFNSIKDNYEFMNHMGDMYKDVEEEYIHDSDIARQVWHTPAELFKPYYGYAIAKHMVSEYKRDPRGADRMIIYEVGAGNGTLMANIMDYILINEPEIYKTIEYNIIEISSQLTGKQHKSKLLKSHKKGSIGSHRGVQIINKSILEWDKVVSEACFFITMEVIDNFSHDLVRYDAKTKEPLQGVVLASADHDYVQAYESLSDPLLKDYLDIRARVGYTSPIFSGLSLILTHVQNQLPFVSNMSSSEFLPTSTFKLIRLLKQYFPNHRLVVADFDQLPDSIAGVDAPVVQTRYQGSMVACSTYLVQPGWFDIFFPTNFELLKRVYREVTGRDAQVMTQRKFLEENADLQKTRTRSGENPMLTFYENFKFILS
ncbi:hypothetical protein QVD99_000957 [Batrachochytrium dendrobatidis]|nr:hypothetical protein QVD99_000957 [Batrachochytrium dendrobatidis]